jgi:cysteine sulfinate desulfinase/cysteine desulfurase-like protein
VLRFSLGRYTTRADIAQAVQALADAVAEIRSVAGTSRQSRKAR